MKVPENLLYTKTHEWVKTLPNGNVQVGLTDHAQHAMGELVYVSLPEPGDSVAIGEAFSDVESVKTASDVFSPVDGVVVSVNGQLADEPQAINKAPYETWLAEFGSIGAKEELLSAQQYEQLIQAEG